MAFNLFDLSSVFTLLQAIFTVITILKVNKDSIETNLIEKLLTEKPNILKLYPS